MTVAASLGLKRKLRVTGRIVFDTAWRIGSGREGQTSDLGVLLDPVGLPMLPGSSIKGKLRSTCEVLAPALGLKACLLNVEASGVKCASDIRWYSKQTQGREAYRQAAERSVQDQLAWIDNNTCDVCKLFGSPVRASRLRCSDGQLENAVIATLRTRDGVVLDRDSHTAVDGLKYDYETVAAGTAFLVSFDLENPELAHEALFGSALFDWATGSTLGGFTSRGLGRFHLEDIKVLGVKWDDPREVQAFLLSGQMQDRGNWQEYFQDVIYQQLRIQPATC
jgi:CRISPR-associated RAMP protein (TIGR02581 family)